MFIAVPYIHVYILMFAFIFAFVCMLVLLMVLVVMLVLGSVFMYISMSRHQGAPFASTAFSVLSD